MKKTMIALGSIAIVTFCIVYIVIYFSSGSSDVLTYDQAVSQLNSLKSKIKVIEVEPYKATLDIGGISLADELPDITKYPKPVESRADVIIEIFSSTEKASSGNDNWLVEVAEAFNRAGFQTSDGHTMGVTVWSIASGTAVDYLVSGKYIPDAFSPSNELWGEMARYHGVQLEKRADRLAGNVAGILTDRDKYNEFIDKYGVINGKTISQAVVANDIVMGYTNPLASSTGLNFILSVLNAYDSADLFSQAAISGFDAFQENVPSVAFSTLELRTAVIERKTLDAMVLEYQLYINEPKLQSYVFTPFGVRHDNPVYALGSLTAEKEQTLDRFIEFCLSEDNQRLAETKGFNKLEDYTPERADFDAQTIVRAQQLWKERKNAGRPVAAFFIADISGSMSGEPIEMLKKSLINAARYIDPENYIGLISYSTDVYYNLPLAKFDLNQQAYFVGSVNALDAHGSTATYNAVVIALDKLAEFVAENPQVKPMIFLLSDGEQNEGLRLDRIRNVVKGMGVPVYTIGYNANLAALGEISQINEASSTNAESDDITYILRGLFNASM